MAGRPKYKMSPVDRAKQFAPFSALKGLERALAKKEREIEAQKLSTHREPAEEMTADEIDLEQEMWICCEDDGEA